MDDKQRATSEYHLKLIGLFMKLKEGGVMSAAEVRGALEDLLLIMITDVTEAMIQNEAADTACERCCAARATDKSDGGTPRRCCGP